MDSLRLILLGVGLVILALIWLFHRPNGSARGPGASRRDDRRREPEPGPQRLGDSALTSDDDDTGATDFTAEPEQPFLPDINTDSVWESEEGQGRDRKSGHEDAKKRNRDPQPTITARSGNLGGNLGGDAKDEVLIVTLYVRARDNRMISGLNLLDAAIKAGLRFGEMKIFHRRYRSENQAVFSMANITRPGNFDPAGWNSFETPGVSLFMRLPGPLSALDGWDAMLATGQRLAEILDADLLDDTQCLLTRQRISQIREQMREFDRKAGLGG